MAEMRLSLLGAAQIAADGETVELKRRKALALLAYLAASEQPQRRETLAAMFWAEFDTTRARAALRQILWELGGTPAREFLQISRETIALDENENLRIDVREFRRLLALAENHEHDEADSCAECLENLTEAARLYQGDFLAGFGLRDAAEFDEWQFWQTENLRGAAVKIFSRLIRIHERQNDFGAAIDYARRLLALDSTDEAAHQTLMRLYAATGQRSATLRCYEVCVKTLRQELGEPPQAETTRLYEEIKNGTFAAFSRNGAKIVSDENSTSAKKPHRSSNNGQSSKSVKTSVAPCQIPTHAGTPFLGRERELAEIAERLKNPDCRLLTLVGAGGTGKTRLALQAAKKYGEFFPDGVCFVSLAAVDTPEMIVSVAADALGATADAVDGREMETKARLLDFLRDKNLLVALDNFDHLLDGAEIVSEILEQTEAVKFLITSRERLNLHAEWLLEVEGLPFPSEQEEDIESFSAVQLFLQAAKRADAKFASGAEAGESIARICRAVEGLPLGIELAASWVRSLSCRQTADEIERGFDLLTTTMRDVPAEHRSIRAVFERSWDFLGGEQRRALRILSVFRGGFRLDAAIAVTGASVPTLLALVDKSLLRRTSSERYEMHELVRQFAAEILRAADDDEEHLARELHCIYYSRRLGETAENEAASERREIWEEIENARAGWRWAVANSKTAEIERYLDFIFRFYDLRGWFEEGYASFAQAVDSLRGVSPIEANESRRILLGKLLVRQGIFAVLMGRNEEARQLFAGGLELFGTAELPEERAQVLNRLGIVIYHLGDYRKAKKHLEKALALYRFLDDKRGIAQSLNRLAYLAGEIKDYAEAENLLEESLRINQSLEGEKEIVDSLNDLGYALYLGGKYERAALLLEKGLALSKTIGYRRAVATTLDNLGCVAAARRQTEKARLYFDEALKEAMEIRSLPIALDILAGTAALLAREKAKQPRALEILAFVVNQSATWKVTKETAQAVLFALEKDLPSEIFAAASKSAKRREINQIIALVFEKAV
ncbi:MAG: tetratricopeptide repeat protein [Acidobacteriota bacterium]|nr:tetratricopeptide repeat protein [Acidobacteriota bacterium]